jgi:hypothetical protein
MENMFVHDEFLMDDLEEATDIDPLLAEEDEDLEDEEEEEKDAAADDEDEEI